jgi:REP element-mobilizing transposase RayT
VTAGLYHLVYACLFVPRFSHHYLSGDLADKLSEWLPNVCVSFGWRLESLAVRPEYLQWVVNVQPNTSPGFVMRMMRQHTNEKIFQTFGRIKKENPPATFGLRIPDVRRRQSTPSAVGCGASNKFASDRLKQTADFLEPCLKRQAPDVLSFY